MSVGRHEPPNGRLNYADSYVQDTSSRFHDSETTRELAMIRSGDHPTSPTHRSHTWLNGQSSASGHAGPSRRLRGFGQQPIIEMSTSPTPSDVASTRSNGTDNSNTTTFFRTSNDSTQTARNDVITPDLVFAEIGHGRGTGPGPSTVLFQGPSRRMSDLNGAPNGSAHGVPSSAPSAYPALPTPPSHSFVPTSSHQTSIIPPFATGTSDFGNTWAFAHRGRATHVPSVSPAMQELHDSVQMALGGQSASFDGREVDARGRSVRRSLKNTLTAAEHYASSFLFGGRGGGGPHDGPAGPAGPASSRDGDLHGY